MVVGGSKIGKKNNNDNNNNRVPGAAGGGVEKEWFQQSASTYSGAGEKENLNINFVGIDFIPATGKYIQQMKIQKYHKSQTSNMPKY